ncbi:hypothetical protein ACFW9U_23375 [Rhodococcus aetherivorans]|uniref:hypothetical protein n=1 Tax=Rhodococcus aetherivorans TaxID=191292 RepID=UPI00366E5F81
MPTHRIIITARTSVVVAIVGIGALGATGAALATPPSPVPAESAAVFVAGDILSFEQTAGRPQWEANAYNRIADGEWTFYESGRFTYRTGDNDPLEGTYTVSGSTVTFSGEYSFNTTTSTSQTTMNGTIDLSADPPVMTFEQASGQVSAAVVNDTSFGSNSTAGYTGTLTVIPAANR